MAEVDGYVELIGMGKPDLIEIKGVTYCGKSAISTLRMEENVPWHHEVRAFAQAIADRTEGAPGRKRGREGGKERGRDGGMERGREGGAESGLSPWCFLWHRHVLECSGPLSFVFLLISPPTSLAFSPPSSLPPSFPPSLLSLDTGEYEFMAEHAHSCCTLLARKKTFYRGGKWYTWIDYAKFHDLIERFEKDGTEFDASDYCAETPAWALKGAPEEGFDPVDTRFRRNKAGVVEEVPYRPTDSGCG
ncbi:flavodoxin family protein [Nannochloropsis gaditana]|uniref:Flavodoxin family protein n=1 Tax=Nannochloropsis gaditana TaxID=72520 RepID=W7T963_9STRA|nr:flavodoxin family protein [Nannochloropsis gaditana]